jgi:hypothetical protein
MPLLWNRKYLEIEGEVKLSSAHTKPSNAVLKARVLKAAPLFATIHNSIGMNIVDSLRNEDEFCVTFALKQTSHVQGLLITT